MRFQTEAAPIVVVDSSNVEEAVRRCQASTLLGTDTETLGKGYRNHTDQIVTVGLCPDEGVRYFFTRRYLDYFKGVLEDENVPKAVSNIKFDTHRFANAGIRLRGPWVDIPVMDYLYDEDTRENRHGVKECGFDYLGVTSRSYSEVFGTTKLTEIVPGHPLWLSLIDYGSHDGWLHREVALVLKEKLQGVRLWHDSPFTLWDHYWDVEEPQLRCLFAMERRGIRIDAEKLAEVGRSLLEEMDRLAREINRRVGRPINPGSPPQLAHLLFEEYKLPVISWTSGGQSGVKKPQCDEDVLKHYAERGVDICDLVLKYRKAQKLKGTYCDGILNKLWQGHIHTTYSATKVTGRLGSSEPNLQNIPRPDSDPHKLRGMFVADPGKVLIVADYSQLEVYILAILADEPALKQALNAGLDIHSVIAGQMFGVSYEDAYRLAKVEEDPEWVGRRTAAKRIVYAILYGMSKITLDLELGFSAKLIAAGMETELALEAGQQEAQGLMDRFLDAFPGVRNYLAGTIAQAQDVGYVQTIKGRFRRLSEILSKQWGKKKHAENQANNAPIQGSAADVVKDAMILIEGDAKLGELGYELLLQVHDELIGQAPEETADECIPIIQGYMEDPFFVDLGVKFRAKPKKARSWLEAK